MFTWNLIHSAHVHIVCVGKGVVVLYYYLNMYVINIFVYLGIDNYRSKSNVQISQRCPFFNVLPSVIFHSSLLLAFREELQYNWGEISVLKLYSFADVKTWFSPCLSSTKGDLKL